MAKPPIQKTVGVYERPEKRARSRWLIVALVLAVLALLILAFRYFSG